MNNNTYQKTLNAYQKRTDTSSLNNDWSSDIENVLEQIRINCVMMSKEHKNKYLFLKGILRYFRIPIILISSVASVASVGLQPYLDQQTISVITCLLSLTCGIIGSIELFLAIQSSMENELMASKDYYILSIEIFKVLTLDRENRSMDGKSFLETSYGTYVKLIENSNILDEKIADRLAFIDKATDSSSDESPKSGSSMNILSYWYTKKKDKKINIEKVQSIDELVGNSLKKNNILSLELPQNIQPLRYTQIPPQQPQQPQQPHTPLPQQSLHPHTPPPFQSQQSQLQSQQSQQQSQQQLQQSQQQSQQHLPLHILMPHPNTPPPLQPNEPPLQPSLQPSLQQRSASFDNLSDLFYDNLPKSFFYNNMQKLPKSLSDSNLQQSFLIASNSSEDIIGISEQNLIDI